MQLPVKNAGFTLIELVITLTILAIITVTAAPRFISLFGESHGAQLTSNARRLTELNRQIHSLSQIKGIANLSDCRYDCDGHPNWDSQVGYFYLTVHGTRLYVTRGYPIAAASNPIIQQNFRKVMELEADNWLMMSQAETGATLLLPTSLAFAKDKILSGKLKCHIAYRAPTLTLNYLLKAETADCGNLSR